MEREKMLEEEKKKKKSKDKIKYKKFHTKVLMKTPVSLIPASGTSGETSNRADLRALSKASGSGTRSRKESRSQSTARTHETRARKSKSLDKPPKRVSRRDSTQGMELRKMLEPKTTSSKDKQKYKKFHSKVLMKTSVTQVPERNTPGEPSNRTDLQALSKASGRVTRSRKEFRSQSSARNHEWRERESKSLDKPLKRVSRKDSAHNAEFSKMLEPKKKKPKDKTYAVLAEACGSQEAGLSRADVHVFPKPNDSAAESKKEFRGQSSVHKYERREREKGHLDKPSRRVSRKELIQTAEIQNVLKPKKKRSQSKRTEMSSSMVLVGTAGSQVPETDEQGETVNREDIHASPTSNNSVDECRDEFQSQCSALQKKRRGRGVKHIDKPPKRVSRRYSTRDEQFPKMLEPKEKRPKHKRDPKLRTKVLMKTSGSQVSETDTQDEARNRTGLQALPKLNDSVAEPRTELRNRSYARKLERREIESKPPKRVSRRDSTQNTELPKMLQLKKKRSKVGSGVPETDAQDKTLNRGDIQASPKSNDSVAECRSGFRSQSLAQPKKRREREGKYTEKLPKRVSRRDFTHDAEFPEMLEPKKKSKDKRHPNTVPKSNDNVAKSNRSSAHKQERREREERPLDELPKKVSGRSSTQTAEIRNQSRTSMNSETGINHQYLLNPEVPPFYPRTASVNNPLQNLMDIPLSFNGPCTCAKVPRTCYSSSMMRKKFREQCVQSGKPIPFHHRPPIQDVFTQRLGNHYLPEGKLEYINKWLDDVRSSGSPESLPAVSEWCIPASSRHDEQSGNNYEENESNKHANDYENQDRGATKDARKPTKIKKRRPETDSLYCFEELSSVISHLSDNLGTPETPDATKKPRNCVFENAAFEDTYTDQYQEHSSRRAGTPFPYTHGQYSEETNEFADEDAQCHKESTRENQFPLTHEGGVRVSEYNQFSHTRDEYVENDAGGHEHTGAKVEGDTELSHVPNPYFEVQASEREHGENRGTQAQTSTERWIHFQDESTDQSANPIPGTSDIPPEVILQRRTQKTQRPCYFACEQGKDQKSSNVSGNAPTTDAEHINFERNPERRISESLGSLHTRCVTLGYSASEDSSTKDPADDVFNLGKRLKKRKRERRKKFNKEA